ncbi:unnamed protein product [Trichogramma brassicae]|uniref:Major facilitator superfamily (MFS) profile domain-containing protein n=1 Tax=Trichogramma brassicae TaxID=86971 RepID=A0A6H5IFC3_9HYME|nr:unnamed protein product [Trichogramma brassicae]
MSGGQWTSWLQRCRESRSLVLVIVAIALLLDNMLLTTVVPIIPEFLYDMKHPNATLNNFMEGAKHTTTTVAPTSPTCSCPQQGHSNHSALEFIQSATAASIEATTVNQTALELVERKERHKELVEETVAVGIMFASKAVVQLLANPIVGPLTHKIGYSIPMFAGFIIMFISTVIFAFGRSYGILFLARALQGIGSSCSSVSGMGMLAERYQDDKERGNAMGIALGGLALGVLIGPPFGGIMYEYVGKSAPFLVLSALALGDGCAITFANMGIAMLEPSLPIWMMDTMGASRVQQGATFFTGQWLAALIGLFVIGFCLMCIPLATRIDHLIVPNAGLGFAIGMVDSSMMPELGYLVDIRHTAVYGSVYAIGDVAFCLGFAIGPALSGTLVNSIGFEWMLFGIAILNFIYAPCMYFLKAPPTKEEKKTLIVGEKSSVRYVTYENEEEDQ